MYEKPNGASKLSFVKEKMLWEDMTETPLYTQQRPHNTVLVPCDKLAEMQAEIEALKKQVDRKDNSIMALDMMIAQFEDKFGDYEKVINGVYSKVKPHEFIEAVKGKENIVGTPIMYAEWPIRNDK